MKHCHRLELLGWAPVLWLVMVPLFAVGIMWLLIRDAFIALREALW